MQTGAGPRSQHQASSPTRLHSLPGFLARPVAGSLAEIPLLLAAMVFLFAGSIVVLVTAGFALGIAVTEWHIVVALFVALSSLWGLSTASFRTSPRLFAVVTALFLLIAGASLFVGGRFYDLSWDGQAYHQETIIRLSQGWNPLFGALPADTPYAIVLEHYPRAGEILGASVYKATGSIEAGKGFNLLFIFASFLAVLCLLVNIKAIPLSVCAPAAFVSAMNPVAVCQALTFYVDGLAASAIASLVALGCLAFFKQSRVIDACLVSLIVLLVNLKFTGLAYGVILLFGLHLALLLTREAATLKRTLLVSGVGLLVAVLVVGFNPYITNLASHRSPFYPISGVGKLDIGLTGNTPDYLLGKNRLESLMLSTFSESENVLKGDLRLKIPFSIPERERDAFVHPDARTGGFGPLFGGIVLLVVPLVAGLSLLRSKQEWRGPKWTLYVVAVLMVSVFINPVTWWARFIPQLWLAPICVVLLAVAHRNRILRFAGYSILAVCLVNIYLVGEANLLANLRTSRAVRDQLEKVAAHKEVVDVCFGMFYSNRVRFRSLGIVYREHKNPEELERMGKTEGIQASTARIRTPSE